MTNEEVRHDQRVEVVGRTDRYNGLRGVVAGEKPDSVGRWDVLLDEVGWASFYANELREVES